LPFPTLAQLKGYLLDRHGLTATGDTSLNQVLNGAIDTLERVSGYRPFVSAGTASDVQVLIERGSAQFPNGALGTVTVSRGGTTYVQDSDYRLYPVSKSPRQGLAWLRPVPPSLPVTVNADWGYCLDADLPHDVFLAVLQHAAGTVLADKNLGRLTVDGERWVDGDVSQTNAGSAGGSGSKAGLAAVIGGQLVEQAEVVFRRYQRASNWG
jgi:hypothetical protein